MAEYDACRELRLRVALVVEGGPGMRDAIVHATRMLRERVAQFRVVTLRHDLELTTQLAEIGVEHDSLGARSARDYPKAIARLARLLRTAGIDVVHGVEPIAGTIANFASLASGRGGRLFDRQHSTPTSRLAADLSRLASKTAHLVRVPSTAAVEWTVAEDRVSRDKVRVVYNAAAEPRSVDANESDALRRSLGIGPSDYVICSVARLRPEKQLEVGLAAWGELREQFPNPVHYVIVGDGPMRGDLERAASGHAHVHFVGHQSDVWPWYAAADIAWMPSANEAFSIAAVEALASGTPLVASRVGGFLETVTPETGCLVDVGDSAQFASATRALLCDRVRRRRLAEAGRSRYQHMFSPAAVAPKIQSIYASLASQDK